MINCKMNQDDQDSINFDVEIVGKSEDVLIELMKINAVLIRNYKKVGFTDKEIEKQLIGCVAAGFALENHMKRKNPKSP